MLPFDAVAENLIQVREAILRAANDAGRKGTEIDLVAVSKTQPVEAVQAAINAGQRCFGENRVQEAQNKFPSLKARYPDLRLHLIGPLQTNKVREAVRLFDVIETVDRPNLAQALAKECAGMDKPPALFIQVNTGEEPQKSGISPVQADQFIALCRDELQLNIRGLMCIPPVNDQPAPHFALLKTIADRHGLQYLSMGMSHDYPVAIAQGATSVRVGTAIFGKRTPLQGSHV